MSQGNTGGVREPWPKARNVFRKGNKVFGPPKLNTHALLRRGIICKGEPVESGVWMREGNYWMQERGGGAGGGEK